jgi:ABC-type bacteriocin/lantibiotic exporter with double-glycine peptidase domain
MKYHRRFAPHSALPYLLDHPGTEGAVTLRVPGLRQARNYTCGFAATLMLLRYYGNRTPAEQVMRDLGTARDGTSQSAIIKVLRDQGLRANTRYDMDFAVVRRAIDAGKAMIGYLVDEEHWVVLYGYGMQAPRVFVADPEPGKHCEYDWEGYGPRLGGFAIVVSERQAQRQAAPSPIRPAEAEPQQLFFDFGSSS